MQREDLTWLLRLAQGQIGQGAELTWSLYTEHSATKGKSLDELDNLVAHLVEEANAFDAQVVPAGTQKDAQPVAMVTISLGFYRSRIEAGGSDRAWVDVAASEFRSEIARRFPKPPRLMPPWVPWGVAVILLAAGAGLRFAFGVEGLAGPALLLGGSFLAVVLIVKAVRSDGFGRETPKFALVRTGEPKRKWYEMDFTRGAVAGATILAFLLAVLQVALQFAAGNK